MPSISATARIAASETQPPACSCARQRIGITADACRPSGYFVICPFAQARFSSLNAKLPGCSSLGARRRTDIETSSLSVTALSRAGQRTDAALPEGACRRQHVVAHIGMLLDPAERCDVAQMLEMSGRAVVAEQLEF